MTALLVVGDTLRTPELRHEVPLAIPDPFLFLETGGARHVVVAALETERVAALDGLVVHPFEELGWDELIGRGLDSGRIRREIAVNACRELGVEEAVVPAGFPLAYAERLREAGVAVRVHQELFDARRRVKSETELAGIRRAQRAAEAGMRACAELLRRAAPSAGGLSVDGALLTAELLKQAVGQAFVEHGATADDLIVAHGAQAAVGHDMGSGPIQAGEPVVVDLWPRDRDSGCFADMTRTFVVGEAPAELREYHRLAREALELARGLVRPGADGRAVHDAVCDHFEAHGYRTTRSKAEGEVLRDGFIHGLGHGVGLEVHERPSLGRLSDVLVAGDVVTIEPGLYRAGWGGVRLEDLLLVTADGAETLTEFPYDLEPAG